MGACYAAPPIGGFVTHQSGCDPTRGRTLHMFDEPWAQEGTRSLIMWHKHRALCHFIRKGHVQHVLRIFLQRDIHVHRWITQPYHRSLKLSPCGRWNRASRTRRCLFTGQDSTRTMRHLSSPRAAREPFVRRCVACLMSHVLVAILHPLGLRPCSTNASWIMVKLLLCIACFTLHVLVVILHPLGLRPC